MDFKNGAELLELCEKTGSSISKVMIDREQELSEKPLEEIMDRMRKALCIMREAAETPIKEPKKSIGGLIGGEARSIWNR